MKLKLYYTGNAKAKAEAFQKKVAEHQQTKTSRLSASGEISDVATFS